MTQLVLSLFPGIGLLDMAFEEEGFCVVRGPDVLWGGDIRRFHPPVGKFDGVIGGPPCQAFSSLVHLNRSLGVEPTFGNLIPEFERCIREASPYWFVMENVPKAPCPEVTGYYVQSFPMHDHRDAGGLTQRTRTISFGCRDRRYLEFELRLTNDEGELAVTGSARENSVGGTIRRRENGKCQPGYSGRLTIERMMELQGVPADLFEHSPFTTVAKRKMIGNGVPLAMGRALAKAVKEATNQPRGSDEHLSR